MVCRQRGDDNVENWLSFSPQSASTELQMKFAITRHVTINITILGNESSCNEL